jgi:hypothetical protein
MRHLAIMFNSRSVHKLTLQIYIAEYGESRSIRGPEKELVMSTWERVMWQKIVRAAIAAARADQPSLGRPTDAARVYR